LRLEHNERERGSHGGTGGNRTRRAASNGPNAIAVSVVKAPSRTFYPVKFTNRLEKVTAGSGTRRLARPTGSRCWTTFRPRVESCPIPAHAVRSLCRRPSRRMSQVCSQCRNANSSPVPPDAREETLRKPPTNTESRPKNATQVMAARPLGADEALRIAPASLGQARQHMRLYVQARLVRVPVGLGGPDGPRGDWRSWRVASVTISTPDAPDRLNNRLAQLLGLGPGRRVGSSQRVWCCRYSARAPDWTQSTLSSTGIALLIVLPTVRVATMGTWFLFHRDPDFALIAALVLVVIIASTLLGAGAA
jgi:hypothetical protein